MREINILWYLVFQTEVVDGTLRVEQTAIYKNNFHQKVDGNFVKMFTFSVLSSNNGVLVFLEAFKAGAEMTKLKFWLYIFISLSKTRNGEKDLYLTDQKV